MVLVSQIKVNHYVPNKGGLLVVVFGCMMAGASLVHNIIQPDLVGSSYLKLT